jgi:hypothetical protein
MSNKAGSKPDRKATADKAPKKTEEDWTVGFRTGAKGGITCDICRCLVRQKRSDAAAHKQWHQSLVVR